MESSQQIAVQSGAGLPGSEDATPSPLAFDPVSLEPRTNGWTPERQRAFIEELADCGIVREAAERVGMTERSAHRLRHRPDAGGFHAAWDRAVRMGGERLRSVAYDRAVNGTLRRRYYHGEVVDEERVYDNRLLTYLLGRLPGLHTSSWSAADFLAADDHGLPAPETFNAPIWLGEDEIWYTNFPPSANFAGEEHGSFGEKNYCRELSPAEQVVVEAWMARKRDREARARDLFFENIG